MTKPLVLVTGAAGFLGRAIGADLLAHGFAVRGLTYRRSVLPIGVEACSGDITDPPSIRRALDGVSGIVHAAARVHVMQDVGTDSMSAYRETNVSGTRVMLDAAKQAGVDRFVFISSVKAVGNGSTVPLSRATTPRPVDAYGMSKLEAEAIVTASSSAELSTSTLRLPLVYGPGMGGNMLRLFALVDRGIPIPLGGVENARSIVYSGNVAAAVRHLLSSVPMPTGPNFVADDRDLSTPELIRTIAGALDVPARIIPIPRSAWAAAFRLGRLLGRVGIHKPTLSLERLVGSLRVDGHELERASTGFLAPFSTADAMVETGLWYRSLASDPPAAG